VDLPIEYMLYVIPAIFAVIIAFVIWQFKLKEKMHYPLAREQDLGIGRVGLSKLGKYYEGPMTTTDNYFAENFSKILAGTSSTEERKNALAFRDKFMKRYTLALKDGGTKIMVTYDDNPLDRKYCTRQDRGADVPIRSIGPIQDCGIEGEYGGFVWYWAKLDKTAVAASAPESEERQSEIAGAKYIRLAAANSEAIRITKEELKITHDQLDQERREKAEMAQECGALKSALAIRTLTPGEEPPKIQNGFIAKAKTWFETPWQFVLAGVAYFVSPFIVSLFGSAIPPTSTAFATLAITVLGFFLIPFAKKVFGRWL
jgi:hypothetical protein